MEPRVAMLCAEIERYVAAHRSAADTATGIRQWWLGELEFRTNQAELVAALDHLVTAGVLSRRRLADGVEIFSAATRVQ